MQPFAVTVLLALCAGAASAQFSVRLPAPHDTDVYSAPAARETCANHGVGFVTKWTAPSAGTSGCSASVQGSWNRYRDSVTMPSFTGLGDTLNLGSCNSLADQVFPGDAPALANAKGLCTWIENASKACACSLLTCVTREVNYGVPDAEAAPCGPLGQELCTFFLAEVNGKCTATVDRLVPAGAEKKLGQDAPPAECPPVATSCPARGAASDTVAPHNNHTLSTTLPSAALATFSLSTKALLAGSAAAIAALA